MANADDPETTSAGTRDASASAPAGAEPAEEAGSRQAAWREADRSRASAGCERDLVSALDRSRPAVAVFVDLENMAWSPDTASVPFDLGRMMAYLERSTRPVLRRVYADWSRMRDFRTPFLRHGFEQVQCTYVNATKNAVDMQLAVDALEAVLDAGGALDGVVLVTADSDFGPLARTLRRRGVAVIGIGWAAKAADLYRSQCDRFVDYETLLSEAPRRSVAARPPRPSPPPAATTVEAEVEAEAAERDFLYDPREDEETPEDGEPPVEEDYAFFETDTGERRG